MVIISSGTPMGKGQNTTSPSRPCLVS